MREIHNEMSFWGNVGQIQPTKETSLREILHLHLTIDWSFELGQGQEVGSESFLSLSLKSIHSLRGLLFSFNKILAPSSYRRALKQFITIFNIYRIIVAFLLKFDKLPTSKPGNHFLERIMREISKEMGLPFCPIWAPAQRGE